MTSSCPRPNLPRMADDLALVLQLLHAGDRRWRTLRAEGDEWADGPLAAEAFRAGTPRGSDFELRGTPEPGERDQRWKAWLRRPARSRVEFGDPHGNRYLVIADGDRICTSHPRAGYQIRRSRGGRPDMFLGPAYGLLSPFILPAALDLEVVDRARSLDRDVFVVRGRPRGRLEMPQMWISRGADELELGVDAERGVLHWLELRFRGTAFRRIAVTEVAFDEDLDDDLFAFPAGPEAPPPVPPGPGRPPSRTRFGPPDDVLGRPVSVGAVVARTPDLVVAVHRVTAYPTGFELELTVRIREAPVEGSFDQIRRRTWGGTSAFPGESLQVGIVFPDGRDARTENFRAPSAADVTLLPMGGSGSQARFDQRFWVAPLPPPGPIGVTVAWESRGLAETRVDLDGAAIVAAAGEAETLWA